MARYSAEGYKRQGAFKEMKVCMPLPLYLRYEAILTSNFSKKPVYGQRSQVICQLVEEYCREAEAEAAAESTYKETENV